LGQFSPNILSLEKDPEGSIFKPFGGHFDEERQTGQGAGADGVHFGQSGEHILDPAPMHLDRRLCFT
jgi:hypothetical protein